MTQWDLSILSSAWRFAEHTAKQTAALQQLSESTSEGKERGGATFCILAFDPLYRSERCQLANSGCRDSFHSQRRNETTKRRSWLKHHLRYFSFAFVSTSQRLVSPPSVDHCIAAMAPALSSLDTRQWHRCQRVYLVSIDWILTGFQAGRLVIACACIVVFATTRMERKARFAILIYETRPNMLWTASRSGDRSQKSRRILLFMFEYRTPIRVEP